MTQETQMLLGLLLGILVMIVLVLKTRTHTFIALLLAALITALVGRMSPADAITAIQDGFGNTLKSTGIIMLITGVGGALGNVVKGSGIGEVLGEMVVSWPIPTILIPVIIAALMRIALGSATVAITTAASLTAPLAPVLGLPAVLLAQASCIGAISFGYFNDSGFWVFNGMFGLTEMKDQLKCKTAVSMVMAGVGVIELMIINLFL